MSVKFLTVEEVRDCLDVNLPAMSGHPSNPESASSGIDGLVALRGCPLMFVWLYSPARVQERGRPWGSLPVGTFGGKHSGLTTADHIFASDYQEIVDPFEKVQAMEWYGTISGKAQRLRRRINAPGPDDEG